MHNLAWKAMSEYTRRKNADANGMVKCVTCGIVLHWTEVHAGHYIPEHTCSILRFDRDNIHPQCPKCNRYHNANLARYTLYMLDKYGLEFVQNFICIDDRHEKVKRTLEEQLGYNTEVRDYFKFLIKTLDAK